MPAKLIFKAEDGTMYPVIFKHGDDLRQDQLILQIISLMDKVRIPPQLTQAGCVSYVTFVYLMFFVSCCCSSSCWGKRIWISSWCHTKCWPPAPNMVRQTVTVDVFISLTCTFTQKQKTFWLWLEIFDIDSLVFRFHAVCSVGSRGRSSGHWREHSGVEKLFLPTFSALCHRTTGRPL